MHFHFIVKVKLKKYAMLSYNLFTVANWEILDPEISRMLVLVLEAVHHDTSDEFCKFQS